MSDSVNLRLFRVSRFLSSETEGKHVLLEDRKIIGLNGESNVKFKDGAPEAADGDKVLYDEKEYIILDSIKTTGTVQVIGHDDYLEDGEGEFVIVVGTGSLEFRDPNGYTVHLEIGDNEVKIVKVEYPEGIIELMGFRIACEAGSTAQTYPLLFDLGCVVGREESYPAEMLDGAAEPQAGDKVIMYDTDLIEFSTVTVTAGLAILGREASEVDLLGTELLLVRGRGILQFVDFSNFKVTCEIADNSVTVTQVADQRTATE